MAIIRQNTCHGGPGHVTTLANSDHHGDPWSTVSGHVAYDVRPGPDRWPCLRLGSPVAGVSSVARTTGTRDALSIAVYVWVPTGTAFTLSVGGTAAGHPSAVWSSSGGLTLGGATVSSAVSSATRDRLVRVEVSASAGTATYRLNHTNPLVTAPDYESSAPYTGALTTVRAQAGAGSRAWLDTLRIDGDGEWLGSGIIGPATTPGYTSSGLWVQLAQQDLMAAGYPLPQWEDDGFYGTEMSTAIQQLQTDHGLLVDGILGPSARAVLDQMLNTTRYPTATGHVGWGVSLAA